MRAVSLLGLLLAVSWLPSCSGTQAEKSVRPGVNERFLSEELDVDWAVGTFEKESRETFAQRHRIVEHLDLAPGMSVADVGAGTGLFLPLMAREVGPAGKVYAVDIAPRLAEHMRSRVRDESLRQVEVLLSDARSTMLPDGSVDRVLLCDTYHHFEYPRSMLASIRRSLRPGGRLVIVDFERIPGESRDWVLDHVRVGKEEVSSEILAAGFTLEDEVKVQGLAENYLLCFRRP